MKVLRCVVLLLASASLAFASACPELGPDFCVTRQATLTCSAPYVQRATARIQHLVDGHHIETDIYGCGSFELHQLFFADLSIQVALRAENGRVVKRCTEPRPANNTDDFIGVFCEFRQTGEVELMGAALIVEPAN